MGSNSALTPQESQGHRLQKANRHQARGQAKATCWAGTSKGVFPHSSGGTQPNQSVTPDPLDLYWASFPTLDTVGEKRHGHLVEYLTGNTSVHQATAKGSEQGVVSISACPPCRADSAHDPTALLAEQCMPVARAPRVVPESVAWVQ